MRSLLPISVFVVVLIIKVSIPKAGCNDTPDPWFDKTYEALVQLGRLGSLRSSFNPNENAPYDRYVERLYEILPVFEDFLIKSELNERVYHRVPRQLWGAFHSFTDGLLTESNLELPGLLESSSLKGLYDSTVMPLMETLRRDIGTADRFDEDGYVLPLERACSTFRPTETLPTLSVKDVCPTVSECSQSFHSMTSPNACEEDNGCDVNKAIPLMIGLLFYKVSFAFVNKFCSGWCSGDSGCNMQEEYASIVQQVDLIKAFAVFTLKIPEQKLDDFFQDAQTRRAYSEIGPAMQIITENDDEFSVARVACNEIEAQHACRVTTFHPYYLLLKKMKEERLHPGDTRDLRLHGRENLDHAKIIQLKRDAIRHMDLLSTIHLQTRKLEAEVVGIASYFRAIARYDQGIADADVEYINGKLTTFNSKFSTLSEKVNRDVEAAMIAMTILSSGQLAEEVIALGVKIAAECNPLKAAFSGVDVDGLRERAVAVAEATAQLSHGIALFVSLGELANDTIEIGTDLHDNQNQIKSLMTLVNKIKNNQAHEIIDDDAETFIEEYARYIPTVDRNRLAQNIAKWGAFKESTCDLLNGVEAIGASVGKAVANGFLLCENLEGTIAEFDALRENIFDFQFELVDSLARVVRGNIGKKLDNTIQLQGQENDMFRADQLLGGFLMAQTFLQSQAWLYCDKLEYKNEGRRVQPCSPQTGLFTNNELDNLEAFENHQTFISIERTVQIPSKPQHRGDLGFINIHTFAKEKSTTFRLPLDKDWLSKFDWSLIGESHTPYVENFQLFLPKKEYKTGSGKIKTSTRIVISADMESGSYMSTGRESSVLYKLPERQTSYVTVYQEGYRRSTCSKEISNPYSLCNNLPNICHTSTGNEPCDSLLPTTLSRWRVTYSIESGGQEVEWLAPNSTTDLNFIAKVKLRMLPHTSLGNERSSIERMADQPDDECCPEDSNTYRSPLVDSECVDCPDGSTSKLGGYYCEANAPTSLKKKQHVFLHGESPKRRLSTVGHVSSSRARKARQPTGVPIAASHARHSNK